MMSLPDTSRRAGLGLASAGPECGILAVGTYTVTIAGDLLTQTTSFQVKSNPDFG